MTSAVSLAASLSAGRMCPFDYRYSPSVLRRAADLEAQVLYVAGGLYGNLIALDEIERMTAVERMPVTIVFNGDFHWFDADPAWFSGIENRVAVHVPTRGNVETEIAREGDIGAGCGCAYPEFVSDGIVQRSNDILRALRATAICFPGLSAHLAHYPMHLVAQIGDARVGIVHGDAHSLAGWRFAPDALDDPRASKDMSALRSETGVDIIASTHTCLAMLRQFDTLAGMLTVINNGSAGMANFANTRFGVISRIAIEPSPHPVLYGARHGGVSVDALAVAFDHAAFVSQFTRRWDDHSPAHLSYFQRIMAGPQYSIDQASSRPLV